MSLVIAIDGTDASGKKTQSDILAETLRTKYGLNVKEVSFPDYDDRSSTLVKMYLGGEFGSNANDTNAYAASSFFAVDRYASFVRHWKKEYDSDDSVIILNRYTTSNAVHQLAKIEDDVEDLPIQPQRHIPEVANGQHQGVDRQIGGQPGGQAVLPDDPGAVQSDHQQGPEKNLHVFPQALPHWGDEGGDGAGKPAV